MLIQPHHANRVPQRPRTSARSGSACPLSFFHRDSDTRLLEIHGRDWKLASTVQRRDPVQIGDSLEPNFVHSFSRAEIASELEAAGFEMVFFSTRGYAHAVGIRSPRSGSKGAEVNGGPSGLTDLQGIELTGSRSERCKIRIDQVADERLEAGGRRPPEFFVRTLGVADQVVQLGAAALK